MPRNLNTPREGYTPPAPILIDPKRAGHIVRAQDGREYTRTKRGNIVRVQPEG